MSDAQGAVVPGATVIVTDEDTGVTREVVSTSEGLFEVPNLRPGTYTVDVSLAGFKAAKRTGILLRAASVARADIQLEVGTLQDVVTVVAEGQNITVESPSIARGLDAQQLRDLPRNSRDIQDFLTLNPNVVGGFDSIQFLGGRTYGASYIQDGQPSSAGIFGELSNAAPGLDAVAEVQVLSNSYSAEFGGLAGVDRLDQARHEPDPRVVVLRLQQQRAECPTYAQALNGVSRDDPNADTHDHRFGFSIGGPIHTNRTFFFGNYEGGRLKALGGGAQAIVPSQAMRAGDFSGASFVIRDPQTGQPFPGNRIPANRLDPAAQNIIGMFYPERTRRTLANGYGTYRQILPLTRNRDRADGRIDHELTSNDSLFGRVSWQRRDPDAFTFESTGGNGGGGLTNLGILDRASRAMTVATGWTRIFSNSIVNELRGGYSEDVRDRRSQYIAGEVGAAAGIRCPRSRRGTRLPAVHLWRREPPVGHPRSATEHVPGPRPGGVLDQQQHDVGEGAHSVRSAAATRATSRPTATPPAPTSPRDSTTSAAGPPATPSPTSCSAFPTPCASSATRAATSRWTPSPTTGRCSCRTTSSSVRS